MTTVTPLRDSLQSNLAWAIPPLFVRTGWRRMAYREVPKSIGERAEPRDTQEEIYVGLEPRDPECLHIRRWGKGSNITGSKPRLRKGDYIFALRCAYKRIPKKYNSERYAY